MATGIRTRHSRKCASRDGKRCNCDPTYEAWIYSAKDDAKIRRSFKSLTEAKTWRSDADSGVRKGVLRAATPVTLREAANAWLKGARDGTIRNRSGDIYKPSVIRGYDAALRLRILHELGGERLSRITRADLQDLVDRWLAVGLDPSSIRNTLMPLRAIYRRALQRGEVSVNPTTGLQLPAVRGKRDRIAAPDEAFRLLGALPEAERALWATAFLAGLRRGELMALQWEDVSLASGRIEVSRSWDMREGPIEPKSRAAKRTVPIPAPLRDFLDQHLILTGRSEGLVFGRSATRPFEPVSVNTRARAAWKEGGLESIGLHECRHTFASLMIAAGVNAKALSTYMGHSSIAITLDRYGKLFPGNEDEAAGLLEAYLERANSAARIAQIG
jgi:integrase